jgi:hypothetical protein
MILGRELDESEALALFLVAGNVDFVDGPKTSEQLGEHPLIDVEDQVAEDDPAVFGLAQRLGLGLGRRLGLGLGRGLG